MRNVFLLGFLAFSSVSLLSSPEIVAQEVPVAQQTTTAPGTILEQREKAERAALQNPFSITQYDLNYVLPVSHVKAPNTVGLEELNADNVDNLEAKYQISMKMPIYTEEQTTSGLYFGFTLQSFWQVYNSEVSKPFRETNYAPEVFYAWEQDYRFLGFTFNEFHLGVNHQSNGQSGIRSRSWNRVFVSAVMSDESKFYYLRIWHRLNEDTKESPTDPVGDDNPDITHYLGHFELGFGTKVGNFKLLSKLRNNLKTSDNKGSIELNLSYPITERYDILLQYFNGYGDSLIDYNRHQQRIGIGVQLNFL